MHIFGNEPAALGMLVIRLHEVIDLHHDLIPRRRPSVDEPHDVLVRVEGDEVVYIGSGHPTKHEALSAKQGGHACDVRAICPVLIGHRRPDISGAVQQKGISRRRNR